MTRGIRQLASAGPARRVAAATAVVVAAFAWGALGPDRTRTLAALAASWIFFAGAATGGLAVSALLELTGAEWAQPLHAGAARLARYLPIAAGLLVLLVAFTPGTRELHGGAAIFFIARQVGCGLGLFAFGWLTLRGQPDRARPAWVLIGYCVLFAFVGSLWAFDFVVLPSPGFSSTLAGPHLFVGAFMSGVGFLVIGAIRAGAFDRRQQRDAATFLLALSIFWAYFFWSQLLTLWYGNLPDEAAFLARRSAHGWSVVTLLVIGATLAVPFILLLSARARASTRVLYVAAGSQLLGLWLERQLLVVPSVAGAAAGPVDLPSALLQLGMAAVFVLSTWPWVQAPDLPLAAAQPGHPTVEAAATVAS